jgi:uncharacterized membrane protein YqaE (UPF0057 family)
MLYLAAILLPPLALFLCGKPFQAILSIVLMLTVIGWIPAMIWAALVASNHYAEKRNHDLIRAIGTRSLKS